MFTPRSKQLLMACLCACLVAQTVAVVTDDPGSVVLDGDSLAGAKLWHRHNCQACHQLYGFGGFLGPDLTNIVSRLGESGFKARLGPLLSEGSGQMPAFGLGDQAVLEFTAFLVAMDQTGTGQARASSGDAPSWSEAIGARVAMSKDASVQAGWEALSKRPCSACHMPFGESPTGAPALSGIATRLDGSELDAILIHGRPPLMPPPAPPLSVEERRAVIALLVWLVEEGASIEASMVSRPVFSWADVPWFEYPTTGRER